MPYLLRMYFSLLQKISDVENGFCPLANDYYFENGLSTCLENDLPFVLRCICQSIKFWFDHFASTSSVLDHICMLLPSSGDC